MSTINQSYWIIRTFDLCQTLPNYLRTFLHENALLTIGLTDQSGYSIYLVYGQSFHPYSIYKNLDTLQKARQSPLRFYIQKSWHFTLRDRKLWSWNIYIKSMTLFFHEVFINKKVNTSQKARHFLLHLYTVRMISTDRLEHNTYIWLVR